jgi:hypothetical protein
MEKCAETYTKVLNSVIPNKDVKKKYQLYLRKLFMLPKTALYEKGSNNRVAVSHLKKARLMGGIC